MYSRVKYSGDGTLKPYTVPFPYIHKNHVEVRLDLGTPLVSGVDYEWVGPSAIAINAPVGVDNLDIRRNTPKDEALVKYNDGSTLVDSDLNLAETQLLFICQEAADAAEATLEVALEELIVRLNGEGGAKVLGYSSGDTGSVVRSIQSKLNDWVHVKDFGAKGAPFDDTQAFRDALASATKRGAGLLLDGITYILRSKGVTPCLVSDKMVIIEGRGATLKLADGCIINTDEVNTNFVPLLQVRGAPAVISNVTFDHNKAGQTIPATRNQMGRGSKPFRHNGALEFCPSDDLKTRARGILLDNVTAVNGYMNGIALWQVRDAVLNITTRDNRWNGVGGADVHNVKFVSHTAYRDGWDVTFNHTRRLGDRAAIQFRELSNEFNTATEGINTITTGSTIPNGTVYVDKLYAEECGCEAIFFRTGYIIGKAMAAKDCGRGWIHGAEYYPGDFWFEFAGGHIESLISWHPNLAPEDMPSDSLVCYPFEGEGNNIIPQSGTQTFTIDKLMSYCGQDFGSSVKKNHIYRSARITSNVSIRDMYSEGTTEAVLIATNAQPGSAPFNNRFVHDITVDKLRFTNTTASRVVQLQSYGKDVRGSISNIRIRKVSGSDMRSDRGGEENCLFLHTPTNFTPIKVDILFEDMDLDLGNSAGQNYAVSVLRGSKASTYTFRNLRLTGGAGRPLFGARTFTTFRLENIEADGMRNLMTLSPVLDEVDAGSLVWSGLTVRNHSGPVIAFAFGNQYLDSWRISGCEAVSGIEGSVLTNLENFSNSTIRIRHMLMQGGILDRSAVIQDVRRNSGDNAPAFNAHHLGEMARSKTVDYIAKAVGTGATDWFALTVPKTSP